MALRNAQRQRRLQRALSNGDTYEDFDARNTLAVDDAAAFTREEGGVSQEGGGGGSGSDISLKALVYSDKMLRYRY
jgi:hypothetical protein